jgi:hypothetical protein
MAQQGMSNGQYGIQPDNAMQQPYGSKGNFFLIFQHLISISFV